MRKHQKINKYENACKYPRKRITNLILNIHEKVTSLSHLRIQIKARDTTSTYLLE